MTNKDLKTGMVVVLGNGERYTVVANEYFAMGVDVQQDKIIAIRDCGVPCIYDSDLTHKFDEREDIVEILQADTGRFTNVMQFGTRSIWKRSNPKKMTVSEICKELGYEVEIVKE